MTPTARRAGGLGIGIPLTLPSLGHDVLPPPDQPKHANLGLGLPQPSQLRWPYTRSVSAFHNVGYDSSSTPSNDSSSSSPSSSEIDSARRRVSESATHDVLLNYFSPALSDAPGIEEGGRKVYLLSRGLKHPTVRHMRSRSETFNFPLPPSKFGGERCRSNQLCGRRRSSSPCSALPSGVLPAGHGEAPRSPRSVNKRSKAGKGGRPTPRQLLPHVKCPVAPDSAFARMSTRKTSRRNMTQPTAHRHHARPTRSSRTATRTRTRPSLRGSTRA